MGKISTIITKAFIEQDTELPTVERQRELGKIIDISISDISPNPMQPRKHFPIDELTGLAKSISGDGIIQPLSVRRTDTGFELISGERRLRAAKIAGLKSVPCIIINADEKKSAILALIENIQRCDLDFFEEAAALKKLMECENITQEQLAARLGLAQSTVANKLRLLRLSPEECRIILSKGLSERHARALLRIGDECLRKQVLLKAAEADWTVETLEKYIRKSEEESIRKESYRKRSVMLKDVRLFFNTVNRAMDVMKMAGVEADAKRVNHKDYIEYIIRIPSAQKQSETENSQENQQNVQKNG
jgi:ParB family chromosome partitioning protein